MDLIKIVVTTCALVALFSIASNYEHHYDVDAEVYSVSENQGTIFKDSTGNMWQVLDTTYIENGEEKPFKRWQKFELYLYDNNTPNDNTDDTIDGVTKIKKWRLF